MLPVFTTGQVKDGVDSDDLMIDLSDYMKKKDGVTKSALDALTTIVANKLDIEPQHKHHIDDIKQLETALASKYDTSQKYSYNVILSDSEKIPYLEAPKVETLEIAANKESVGYKLYVDDSSGDLMVVSDGDVLIATYIKATGNWIFGGVNLAGLDDVQELTKTVSDMNNDIVTITTSLAEHDTHIEENAVDIISNDAKINALSARLDEYISKTDAILKNHYDAIMAICEKLDMVETTAE